MKPKYQNQSELAAAWLAATTTQSWEDFEAFASVLYTECCRQIPPCRLKGVIEGAESEVRQETCLMLLGGFLLDNPHLPGERDAGEIERHLVQSVRICSKHAIARIVKQRGASREIPAAHNSQFGTVDHPRCRTYGDLTFNEKRALALSALQLAVEEAKLTERSVQIAKLILEEGLSQREVAKRMGISPSAINQQLTRVAAKLSILKDAVEISQP